MESSALRSRFLEYFERHGHRRLPSSSLVPADDPTLLFTNAGMVQFKRIFVGEQPPSTPRATTAQKCLRVSGKHNDLEEVGRTARHHTFFEMLGNFSFGDYFKRDAIGYAWEFVTGELALEPGRLWATVHHSDDEAYDLWLECSELPPERVLRLGDKENFWQMGDTGPCGPCSELHYDLRAGDRRMSLEPEEFLRLGEADQFTEIWNLVFMQFDRGEEGDRPLPAPSIDTGAGLERIAAILQETRTSYHTDLFLPLIEEVEGIVGRGYSRDPERWEEGLPFRVLADHARALAFMLADGVFPSNEGRGYVLRRILRRAGRYAWLLGRREPTLDRLVGVVADRMSDVYPELAAHRDHLLGTTRAEEERFLSTIDAGMSRFDEVAPAGAGGTIAGEDAFHLYDTFGFPLDLTQLMAGERGCDVDVAGFQKALEGQRRRSRGARERGGRAAGRSGLPPEFEALLAGTEEGVQQFVGYDQLAVETSVVAYGHAAEMHGFVLASNPFYAEAGGQVSDSGSLAGDGWRVRVDEVIKDDAGVVLVAGPVVEGTLDGIPTKVRAEVDEVLRRDAERNHTATHLLHAALRAELGEHVQQAGSLVAPDRLRFDFSHHSPLTAAQRRAIERAVNEDIWANIPLGIAWRGYRDALAEGAMALFGEKYGDRVRIVKVPGVSAELCGGCHVRSTGQLGLFRIVSETGVAAGIRRIEAVTGPAAYGRLLDMEAREVELAALLRTPPAQTVQRVAELVEERRELESQLSEQKGRQAADVARRSVENGTDLPGGGSLVCAELELPPGTDLPHFGDQLRGELGSGAAIIHVRTGGEEGSRFLSVVTEDWIDKGLRAGDLVRAASAATRSGGGGRAHFAQGGVGDVELATDGLEAARRHVLALVGTDD